MSASMPLIAVVNNKPDVAGMLRKVFEREGVRVEGTSLEHTDDEQAHLETFLRQHEPDILCFDFAAPFDRNWAVLRQLLDADVQKVALILTTPTDLRAIRWFESQRKPPTTFEVVGTSAGLDNVVNVVRRTLGSSARHSRPMETFKATAAVEL